jgi:hypothetical protein
MRILTRHLTNVVPLALLMGLATSGLVLSNPGASVAPAPAPSVMASPASAAPASPASPEAPVPGQVSVYYSTNIGGEVDPCG